MNQFKRKPPMVHALEFKGDYANACDVITELSAKGITASFVPEIELEDRDGQRSVQGNHILILGARDTIYTVTPGEWIVWDPELSSKTSRTPTDWRVFDIMVTQTVERLYMNRTDEEN